jgi:hypothetical protein
VSGTQDRGLSDGAMLALIGAVLAVCAFIWAWGGIAGLAFGGGWPTLGPG